MSDPSPLVLIDNFDSFVHNLARYFQRLGQRTIVLRNDQADVARVRQLRPAALVLSPGPCSPDEAGHSLELVSHFHQRLPLLGICLGHQTIVQALGGRIVRASRPRHGRASPVRHDRRGVFVDIDNPFSACRYHSLVAAERSLPADLEVTAHAEDDGCVMAVRSRGGACTVGLQFHPESVLTPPGYQLLANFLRGAGLPLPARVPDLLEERPPIAADRDADTSDLPPVPF